MKAQDQATVRTPQVEGSSMRRAIVAVSVGNFVEWFDYATYGYLAVTLGVVFFPFEDPTLSLLSSLGVFGIAFFARPFGGFFFGPLGDKIGRQRTLAAVIILMSAATFLMGFLPGYATIGILAPVLLIVLRLLQGFSTGGEFGGAATFLAEYSPENRRGFIVSWVEFSAFAGIAMGSGIILLLTSTLSEDAMTSWGWRIPFLMAGPLGLIGLYMRLRLEDTPKFKELERSEDVAQNPLRETIAQNWKAMLQVGGLVVVHIGSLYVVTTFMYTYISEQLGFGAARASLVTLLAIGIQLALFPLLGALSDRIGRKPLMIAACAGFVLLSYPLFLVMNQGSVLGVVLGQVGLGALVALYISASVVAYTELFATRVRYGGLSIAYNLSTAVFGGAAPFFAAFLISSTGNPLSPAFYLIAIAVVSLLTLATVRETARDPLR